MKKTVLLFSVLTILSLSFRLDAQVQQKMTIEEAIAFYVEKVNADSIQSYMQTLQDFGTRFCLAPNRKAVATWIKDKFISLGYPDTQLDSFAFNYTYGGNYYQTWQYNVVATYQGFVNPSQVYVMGGHYDAIVPSSSNPLVIAPGADDNASGVAAAIEVARIMKKYSYVPESTIKFIAFAAEELGLHGAWNYANKAFSQNMNIVFMLNNDMISYCTVPPTEWKLRIQKYPNSQSVTNLAHYIAENFTSLTVTESTQYIQSSDSWPFYSKGYKAIFLQENQFTPHYHTVNDLVIHSNMAYAAEMVKVSLGMLVHENGTGIIAGATCGDPLVVDLPLNYTGSTELYGNHYAPNWLITNPPYLSNYIAGNDLVFSFTLASNSLLSGDISCPVGNKAGVFILSDCPNIFNAPVAHQFAGGNAGGSFNQLPLPAGNYYAIVSNWPQPLYTSFTLNLSSIQAQQPPELIASPAEINFGTITVGNQSAVQTVLISNHGSLPLNINSLSLTGSNPDQFLILGQSGTLPLTLQFGESTEVDLVFIPTQIGQQSAFLTIAGNMPDNVNLPVYGNGLDNFIIFTPYTQDFNEIIPGQLPSGWIASHPYWNTVNSNFSGGVAPELMFSGTSEIDDTYRLVINPVNAFANTTLNLMFRSLVNDNPASQNTYTLKLQSSFDGGINWTDQWVLNPAASIPAQVYTVNLESLAGEMFLLSWVYEGEPVSMSAWYIDNIFLSGEDNPVIIGDANCDGIVNVLDVITTINYILGVNPTPFCFENADTNLDGIINVLDVIATVNIVTGGTKTSIADLKSGESHITLNSNSIDLRSDGTLAGLQFEITGQNLDLDDIVFELSGYEFACHVDQGKLIGLIYSLDNTPFPYGDIRLISFRNHRHDMVWGNVVAGNINAENVPVIKHTLNNLTFTREDYKLLVYPNPARYDFTVEVNLPASSETFVRIIDMVGRDVVILNKGYLEKGTHKFIIGGKDKLKPGFYLLNIVAKPEGVEEVITRNLKLLVE